MSVNCLELHRAIGADPNFSSPELMAHRAVCPDCERYVQETLRMNALIKRALQVAVPENLPQRPRASAARSFGPRWWAMAASAVITVGVVVGILAVGTPQTSLAGELVEHMAHEPDAMTSTSARVASDQLDGALRAKGLHLAKPVTDMSYLQSCRFRGNFVPHLVVQTERGPVTVIILLDEKIATPQVFSEQQYHGTLVPIAKGGIAVIATDADLAQSIANRMATEIVWN